VIARLERAAPVALVLLGVALWPLTTVGQRVGVVDVCAKTGHVDHPREGVLWSLLAATAQGRALVARLSPLAVAPRICFLTGSDAPGVLRTDGVALLDARSGHRAGAARLAHLLVHQLDRLRALPARGRCAAWLARRLQSEVAAHRLEAELRRTFALRAELAFEHVYWRAAAGHRRAALRAWLRRPHGLLDQYRRRCRR
jgi:hypothetical protein